jgi:ribonuclease PH
VVANSKGHIIEVQGTAEGAPMERKDLDSMVDLALEGIVTLTELQLVAMKKAGVKIDALVG